MCIQDVKSGVTRLVLFRVLGLCLIVLVSREARAQSAVAQTLFDEGKQLMADGRTSEACDKFAASEQAQPSTGALLNLAVCHKKLGKIATAWAEFKRAVPRARKDGREDRVEFAEREAGQLYSNLSYVTLKVHDSTASLPGVEATLDTTTLPSSSFGVALPADPGSHTLTVRAPGHEPWSKPFTLIGKKQRQTIDVPALRALARHVTLTVNAPQGIVDLEVALDGSPLGTAQLGKPQQVGLGRHRVSATAPGYEAWERTVDLTNEGASEEVVIPRLRRKSEDGAPTVSPKARQPGDSDLGESNSNLEADDRGSRKRSSGTRWSLISGFTLTGLGVAATATGIVFGQYARSQATTAVRDDTLCPRYKCTDYGFDEQVATAKFNAKLANILVPSGAALVLAGVGFFVLGDHGKRASAPLIRPYLAADAAGLDLGGTF